MCCVVLFVKHTHTHTAKPPACRCWEQAWCWQEHCRCLLPAPLTPADSALQSLGSTHTFITMMLVSFIILHRHDWKLKGYWNDGDWRAAVQMQPAGLLLTGCRSAVGCTAESEVCKGQRTGEPRAPSLWLPDTPPYPAHHQREEVRRSIQRVSS